jgi:orotidine-5'-phosphate decarboxylase
MKSIGPFAAHFEPEVDFCRGGELHGVFVTSVNASYKCGQCLLEFPEPACKSCHVSNPSEKIIVALDVPTDDAAFKLIDDLCDSVRFYKVGLQLFTKYGQPLVQRVKATGAKVFLDLKFHDIPNTVAGAVLSAAAMTGVQLVNVHALGGKAMLEAAVQAISAGVPMDADRPRLLAVTILTSMNQKTMKEVGISSAPKLRVVKLAQLAKKVGVDGVVASVQEAKAIRKACGRDFLIVTPGVRPKDSKVESRSEDQARKATPTEAIRAGADFLVVGRPILAAQDPRAEAQSIVDEIAAAK